MHESELNDNSGSIDPASTSIPLRTPTENANALSTSSLDIYHRTSSKTTSTTTTTLTTSSTTTEETTTTETPEPTEEPVIIVVSSTTFTSFRPLPSRTRIPGVVYTDDPYSTNGGASSTLSENGGLNTGAVVGIALALTGLTVALVLAVLYWRTQRRKRDQSRALAAEAAFEDASTAGGKDDKDPEMAMVGNDNKPGSMATLATGSMTELASASGGALISPSSSGSGTMQMMGTSVEPLIEISNVAEPVAATAGLPSEALGGLGGVGVGATAALLAVPAAAAGAASLHDGASVAESYDAFSFVETLPELLGPPAPVPVGPPQMNVKERTAAKRRALAEANAHLYSANTVTASDGFSILSADARSVAPSMMAPSVAASLPDRGASPLPTVDMYLQGRDRRGLTADDASSIMTGAPFIMRRLPSTMSASTLQSAVVRALNYPSVAPAAPVAMAAVAADAVLDDSPPGSPVSSTSGGSPGRTKGPRPIEPPSPTRVKPIDLDADNEEGGPPSPAGSDNSQVPLVAGAAVAGTAELQEHPRIVVEPPSSPAASPMAIAAVGSVPLLGPASAVPESTVQHPPNTFFVEIGRPFNISLSLPPAEAATTYKVLTKEGQPVPTWLRLDYKTGMLGGTPYFGEHSDWFDVVIYGAEAAEGGSEEEVLRELRIVLQDHVEDGRSEFASIWSGRD